MRHYFLIMCCITALSGCSQNLFETWLIPKTQSPAVAMPVSAKATTPAPQPKISAKPYLNITAEQIDCDHTLQPQYRAAILSAINQIRSQPQQCGQNSYPATGNLVWSEKLQRSATHHAQYISTAQILSHYGPQGQSLKQRVQLTTYKGGGGENLASGQQNVKQVLENWLGLSPGHCDNLMQSKYKHYALVCVRNSKTQRPYWVQHFGSGKKP